MVNVICYIMLFLNRMGPPFMKIKQSTSCFNSFFFWPAIVLQTFWFNIQPTLTAEPTPSFTAKSQHLVLLFKMLEKLFSIDYCGAVL